MRSIVHITLRALNALILRAPTPSCKDIPEGKSACENESLKNDEGNYRDVSFVGLSDVVFFLADSSRTLTPMITCEGCQIAVDMALSGAVKSLKEYEELRETQKKFGQEEKKRVSLQ